MPDPARPAAPLGPLLSALPAGRRRIPAALWDAAEVAKGLVASAEVRAEEIRSYASAEVEALRAEAVRSGREEGFASATELLARAASERDELLACAERDLVKLAFAIAKSVLASAVGRDPDAVVESAARALDAARHATAVRLRAHPADRRALESARPDLAARLSRAAFLELVDDPAVARGGVVVESEAGTVDDRLETQLLALERALEARAGSAAGAAG